MTDQKLRVREVSPADPNYVHARPEPSLEPSAEHGGLRVRTVAPKGTRLVESHPNHPSNRKHPEHDSLAALGSRERK